MSVSVKTRILAFVCQVCPFCVAARLKPDSAFAKKLREKEENCPACRAYHEWRADKNAETD
ncbi:hypothetical protein JW916_05500 [Candidatus Sumerlaeota bacterium]|nr:hypothetical protein [Candidatus Sumerlaeota bacterium]